MMHFHVSHTPHHHNGRPLAVTNVHIGRIKTTSNRDENRWSCLLNYSLQHLGDWLYHTRWTRGHDADIRNTKGFPCTKRASHVSPAQLRVSHVAITNHQQRAAPLKTSTGGLIPTCRKRDVTHTLTVTKTPGRGGPHTAPAYATQHRPHTTLQPTWCIL